MIHHRNSITEHVQDYPNWTAHSFILQNFKSVILRIEGAHFPMHIQDKQ